jgi:hypothetical protein
VLSIAITARTCVAAVGLLAGSLALADTSPGSQFSTEVGVGYEVQSSPLIRISPQGELISIDGLQQLGNSNVNAGVQGFTSWQFGNDLGLSLAGDASQKHTPGSQNFDFGNASVQPALHWVLPWGSVGWGLSFQHLDVAGRAFRDVRSTQFDWTVASPDGNHWAVVVDVGTNRHPDEFSDMDANTESLVLQRHLSKPIAGIEALDFSAYLSQERNSWGFEDLSHRNLMLAASLHWQWQGLNWSAGATLQKAQFAESAFDDEPVRVDRAVGIELSVERELTPQHTLRVEYSEVRNVSTIRLFDNQYQQFAVKLRSTW